jgi:hypothetical protein
LKPGTIIYTHSYTHSATILYRIDNENYFVTINRERVGDNGNNAEKRLPNDRRGYLTKDDRNHETYMGFATPKTHENQYYTFLRFKYGDNVDIDNICENETNYLWYPVYLHSPNRMSIKGIITKIDSTNKKIIFQVDTGVFEKPFPYKIIFFIFFCRRSVFPEK